MKTIWKFEVSRGIGIYEVNMPRGAQVLSVDTQEESICVWAEVESENELARFKFCVRGTGMPYDDVEEDEDYDDVFARFIGTVQINCWVWHIYQDQRPFNIKEERD